MKYLAKIFKDIFLCNRLLYSFLAISFLFCLGFAYPIFVGLAKILLLLLFVAIAVDYILLFNSSRLITGKRLVEDKLSNGDYNPVMIHLTGKYGFKTNIKVVDELPHQFQLRDKSFQYQQCAPHFSQEIIYEIRPTQRGEYHFGDIHVFVSSFLALLSRRVTISAEKTVKVYPSFIQYRKYAFFAISNRLEEVGVKKIRKLGINNEFEQIREYVRGDDFRTINWKVTARRGDLMVNQYQDEKAQNVYCMIDKGRFMHMPFGGLSLMDYAINASLVLSGIALRRGDKAGLISFSDKIGDFIMAKSQGVQMRTISDALYKQSVRLKESDYLRLYKNIKTKVKKRSLLVLFTNFDSIVSLQRQMKYLRAIARDHLLLTIIFDNSEINEKANQKAFDLKGVYKQTMTEKYQYDKRSITKELNKNGIQCILTEPTDLTINTINRYIELKARGSI